MNGSAESERQPLPDGWRWVKLGERGIFRVESGGTPKSGVKEYWDGGVPWITLVDLPADDIITEIISTNRTISETGLANSAARLLPANSVVVSSRATIGRIGINRMPLATNQGFKNVVVEDTTQAMPEYVALALTELVPTMQAQASGSTYKEIIKSRFSQLRIPLPPLAEQQRIVRILDEKLATIEKAKRAAEDQLEAADAMSGAYLREVIPPSGARLPKGWRWENLGNVCSAIRGVTFKTRDTLNVSHPNYVACLTTSGVQDTPDWESRRYVSIDSVKRTEQFLATGDILVSTANSKVLVGKSCIMIDLPEPCTFGAFVTVVRPQDCVSAKYVSYSMRTPESKAYFYNNSSNTTNISNLKTTDLCALPIPLPLLPEQKRIVRILDDRFSSIDLAKKTIKARLEMINALSTAYLRQAFAGEL